MSEPGITVMPPSVTSQWHSLSGAPPVVVVVDVLPVDVLPVDVLPVDVLPVDVLPVDVLP